MSKLQNKLNLIMMFTAVDKGMAGTARLRNFVNYRDPEKVRILNIVRDDESASYEYNNVQIERVNFKAKNSMALFTTFRKLIRDFYDPERKNIILYFDTPHTPLFLSMVYMARTEGYTIVADVVEDYSTQEMIFSFKGNMRIRFCRFVQKNLLAGMVDGAICISHHLMDMIKDKMGNKPIAHIPVAFDPANIVEQNGIGNDSKLRVFYGGSFAEKDGLEYLIEGFSKAREKNQDLRLEFTGKANSKDSNRVKELIEKSAYSGDIVNHGFVEYDDYCRILGSADILCMTRNNSAFAKAGFPYKLGEYLATGKPVIVSRLPEIEKYLDKEDCYFVTPESSDEIARAISQLQEPSNRENIGRNGKKMAYEHFNAELVTKELYSFLESM